AVPLATAAALGLINPFNIAASNQSVLAAVSNFEQYGETKQRQLDVRAIIDGELFRLPGGGVKVAVGAEYIWESFWVRNALIQAGTENTGYPGLAYNLTTGTLTTPVTGVPTIVTIIPQQAGVAPTSLSRRTKSVFGELVVPIFGADNATTLFNEL